jgi:hypothetical protein
MDEQVRVDEIKENLVSFKRVFEEYAKEIFSDTRRREHLDELRTQLQLQEPKITKYVLGILGDSRFEIGSLYNRATLSTTGLLSSALLGGNNELPHNFRDYNTVVTSLLNRAIGKLEAGLWPPKEPRPILIISDKELRDRCSDLLAAPSNYDRVIREATTVLENRIRNKVPHDVLSRLIPQSADQAGENLVNKMFSPDNPILSISNEKSKRIALHKILLGIFSYLRNPYHHKLDPHTEWSWAWSTVGLIDRVLVEIDDCVPVLQ